MRIILLLIIFILGCASESKVNFVSLRESTVTILDGEDEYYHVSCAGVWVDEDLFLTAAHCVDNNVVKYQIFNNYNTSYGGIYPWGYEGVVIKKDNFKDLALVLGYHQQHNWVQIKAGGKPGDEIWSVGHPNGYEYSIVRGMISGVRRISKDKDYYFIWQVDANIGPGNSGGGLYDSKGELIGICSFINTLGARYGFFITGKEIVKFLK